MSDFLPKPLLAFMGTMLMIGSGYGLIQSQDSIPWTIVFGMLTMVGVVLLASAFIKDEGVKNEPSDVVEQNDK